MERLTWKREKLGDSRKETSELDQGSSPLLDQRTLPPSLWGVQQPRWSRSERESGRLAMLESWGRPPREWGRGRETLCCCGGSGPEEDWLREDGKLLARAPPSCTFWPAISGVRQIGNVGFTRWKRCSERLKWVTLENSSS